MMYSYSKRRISTFQMLFKQIGGLLILLGVVMSVPAIVSLIYGEYFSAMGFVISMLICLFVGFYLSTNLDSSPDPLSRHTLMIAALGWLSIAILGALPFFIIAHITPNDIAQQFVPSGANYLSSLSYFKNPLHAIFESMSAFTTTGLTMAVHEPSVGKGILFYRSLAQWVGGAGFIVLSLAVLKQSNGRSALLLYGSETTGERLMPTIIETARSIWKTYLGLTLFSTIYLIVGTWIILPGYNIFENIFDSINHAMCGQSTGGFSTLDDSIAGYQSYSMDMLYLLPMFLGSLSLPFYFKMIYNKQINLLWKDTQTRAIILFCLFGGIIQSLLLYLSNTSPEPFRTGIFQFISALTTTGWQTSDVSLWDSASNIVIVSAMIVGGAAGATVGGIKVIRFLLILKGLRWQVNNYFNSASSINVVNFNGKRFLPDEMNKELASAATFAFIYIIFVLLSTLATYFLMPVGFTMSDALFESASAQGTVGLSTGITTPNMSAPLEAIYIIQMWAGRLEIFPILILLRTILWGPKPNVE